LSGTGDLCLHPASGPPASPDALPEAELRALRQSTRELAAIGRNLNQIARATHQGGSGAGVGREDLWGLLKACEALRDHVRAYISTNLYSWGFGDATSQS
jgi:Bacterial mobilisation protein (MobC)